MVATEDPKAAITALGNEIGRLRVLRGWSRIQLVHRLWKEFTDVEDNKIAVSEDWLERLENGRVIKVPRYIIDALCRTLECSSWERSRVLLLADRSILWKRGTPPDTVATLLTYVMGNIYEEAHIFLMNALEQRAVEEISELERLEIVNTALRLIMKEHS
jgi:DNA-binding Xre family transcriptional regulator